MTVLDDATRRPPDPTVTALVRGYAGLCAGACLAGVLLLAACAGPVSGRPPAAAPEAAAGGRPDDGACVRWCRAAGAPPPPARGALGRARAGGARPRADNETGSCLWAARFCVHAGLLCDEL